MNLLCTGDFPLVCTDEAGCANSCSTVLQMMLSQRMILCGDHLQLPPFVISDEAISSNFKVSLMETLVKTCPERVSILKMQYR